MAEHFLWPYLRTFFFSDTATLACHSVNNLGCICTVRLHQVLIALTCN